MKKALQAIHKNTILVSPNDKSTYKYLKLSNGLRCVLISDSKANNSAAVMGVSVGSFEDPKDSEGLAHFLEHMLFMGSNDFPAQNVYSKFLTENGGSSNAYTDVDATVYYFNVMNEKLEHALRLFSGFFTGPLLNKKSANAEVKAVISEHEKNLSNDSWRFFQLLRHISQSGSPYNGFSTGNMSTLGKYLPELMAEKGVADPQAEASPNTLPGDEVLMQKLKAFYAQKYSANLMNLVVCGKEPIEKLEEYVDRLFGCVQNKELPPFSYSNSPKAFSKDQLGKLIHFQTLSKTIEIKLIWQFDCNPHEYDRDPFSIVSHILGHESEGSLLSSLKSEHLAFGLSTGLNQVSDLQKNFEMSIKLSETGWKNVDRVIQYIGNYIRLLVEKRQSLHLYFTEVQRTNKTSFYFQEKSSSLNNCTKVLGNLMRPEVPENECLVARYLMESYDQQRIDEILKALTLDNALLTLKNDTFDHTLPLVEPIYSSSYNIERIPQRFHDLWNTALDDDSYPIGLPSANTFIPNDFEIVKLLDESSSDPSQTDTDDQKQVEPKLLLSNSFCKFYFKQDNLFRLPKVNYRMKVYCNFNSLSSPLKNQTCFSIWNRTLNEFLNEFVYTVEMAKAKVSFYQTKKGLEIAVNGYSDSFVSLMPQLGAKLTEFIELPNCPEGIELLRRQFKTQKELLVISTQKELKKEAYMLAVGAVQGFLVLDFFPKEEQLEALHQSSFEDFLKFHKSIFSRNSVESLINGNIYPENAVRIHKSFLDNFLWKSPCCQTDQRTDEENRINHSLDKDSLSELSNNHLLRALAKTSAERKTKAHKHDEVVLSNPSAISNMEEYFMLGLNETAALPLDEISEIRTLKIPDNTTFIAQKQITNPKEQNSCALICYFDRFRVESRFLFQFLLRLMEEPFFDDLRTKQQLGYIVKMFNNESQENHFCSFLVQTTKLVPNEIAEQVNVFLENIREKVTKIEPELFHTVKQSLISDYKKKFNTLEAESHHLFDIVVMKKRDFLWKQHSIEFIERVTKEEIEAFAKEVLFDNRRVLEIQLTPDCQKEKNNQRLEERKHQLNSKLTSSQTADNKNLVVVSSEKHLKKLCETYPDVQSGFFDDFFKLQK